MMYFIFIIGWAVFDAYSTFTLGILCVSYFFVSTNE